MLSFRQSIKRFCWTYQNLNCCVNEQQTGSTCFLGFPATINAVTGPPMTGDIQKRIRALVCRVMTIALLMQWAMGLMSTDEIDLRETHRDLLKQRAVQKGTLEEQRNRLETLWPPLRQKLDVQADAEVESEQMTFNSFRPADYVNERVIDA